MIANKSIDLFIVEDNKLVSLAINAVIRKVADFNVLGLAEDGESAIVEIINKRPDVALVDIGLPALDGIEVTRQVKMEMPALKVLMLTASDKDGDIIDALSAGADGYLLKDAFSERLEMAVRAVRVGAVWLDPAIAGRLLLLTRRAAKGERGRSSTALSAEEFDILGTVAQSECKDNTCLVDPGFLKRIHASFSKDTAEP